MDAEQEPDEPFRPPLPMEDRLWRHPSEVAAAQRAPAPHVTVTTITTPVRQAIGLAVVGAVGGALLVSGLFLTIGTNATTAGATDRPVIQTLALDPIVPVLQAVPAETWPGAVAEGAAPGLARISVSGGDGPVTGSGVLFRSDGFLLTSYDLVSESSEVEVTLQDGSTHNGTVLGTDSISGLAVVAITQRDTPTARLGIMTPPPEVGDYAVALPGLVDAGGLEMAIVSALSVNVPVNENQDLHGLLQLDVSMPPGATGGAIIDDTGSVIAIMVDLGTRNATYAVPIGYARKIAADIIMYGYGQHAWLGIKGIDLTGTAAADVGAPGAVRIQNVLTDSPAHQAGLEKGDIVIAVDTDPVTSMTELILELRGHPPGETIDVSFVRAGERMELSVALQTRLVANAT